LISFNKIYLNKNYNVINNIRRRFTKKSCIVNLHYEDFDMKGICISWYHNKYLYLDKFFVFSSKKGIGISMLDTFIRKYSNENKLIWRTDTLTSRFYLKHKDVIEHFEINSFGENNKRKVYLGTGKINWEYEDIYDLNIKSCFE